MIEIRAARQGRTDQYSTAERSKGSCTWLDSKARRWLERLHVRFSDVEPDVLVVLAIGTVAVWGVAEIAGEVLEGDTDAFDRWVVRAMRDPDNPAEPFGPRWLEEMGRDATALGGIGWLTVMIVVAVFLWFSDKTHMMLFMLAATTSGAIVYSILKSIFSRPRPDFVPHLSRVYSSSFPSGHSMLSAAMFLTLGSLLAAVMPWLQRHGKIEEDSANCP